MNTSTLNIRDCYEWGGKTYPGYEGRAEVSAATVAPPATPAPSGGAPATGSQPAEGGQGGQTPTASPTATDPNAENLRVLRESYDAYSKLGKVDEIAPAVTTFKALHTEGTKLATDLGYDAKDFAEAFKKDPVATLSVLRREARNAEAQRGSQPAPTTQKEIDALVRKQVAEATRPIQEQFNLQKTNEANALFDSEANTLISTDFKDHPKEVQEFLYDMTSEILKYDEAGLVALKAEGKTAAVKAAYAEAKDMFMKVVTAYNQHVAKQTQRGGGNPPGATGGQGGEKLSLDDIIDGNEKATKVIGSFR